MGSRKASWPRARTFPKPRLPGQANRQVCPDCEHWHSRTEICNLALLLRELKEREAKERQLEERAARDRDR